jgi:hypothetical protein
VSFFFRSVSITRTRYGGWIWTVGGGPSTPGVSFLAGSMIGGTPPERKLHKLLSGPSAQVCGGYAVGACVVDENPAPPWQRTTFFTRGHPDALEAGFMTPALSAQGTYSVHPTARGIVGGLNRIFVDPIEHMFDHPW